MMRLIDEARTSGRRGRRHDLRAAVRRRERRGARPAARRRPAAEPRRRSRARAAARARRPRRPTSPRAPSTPSTAGSSSATTGSSTRSSGRRPSSGRATRPRSTAPPPVWERLAESGLRTLAIDPYESRPPAAPTGVFVCGWGFADRVVLPRWSRPEGRPPASSAATAADRGDEIFGRPRVARPARPAARSCSRRRAGSRRSPRSSWRASASTSPGSRSAPPTSRATSSGTSRSSTPRPSTAARERLLETALDDVYAAVDDALGRVLAALPPGADVIVTSPVGMDVNTSRADLLPEMLARGARRRPGRRPRRAGAIWRLRAAMPAGLRGARRRRDPRPRGARADRPARAAWARLGARRGPSPTRRTTRATSGSTFAAASATASSTRPMRTP